MRLPLPTSLARCASLLLVLGAFALSPSALAQGVTSSAMRGSVVDAETGEPLPGANVVATHLPTGTEYGAATDADGTFAFRNMRVGGPYRIRASYIGYREYSRDGIALVLGETYETDIALSPSAAALDDVEVVAEGDIFDANRTGVNTNIAEERIATLPTVGRDLADVTRLTPQAYVENDDDDGPAISIAGQNNRYNTIYIDGAVSNDVFGLSAQGTNGGQTGATPISLDAVEQFQVAISPFDVTQSGFTGGAINAVTRSGSNTFEGSVYGFFRNEGLAGDTPGPLVGEGEEAEPLPEFTNNRYGFRVGGPIVKNKVFFFVNGEFLRAESPQPFEAYTGETELGLIRQTVDAELGYDPGDFGAKSSNLDDNKLLAKLDWNINRDHRLSLRHSYTDAENTDRFRTAGRFANFANNSEVFPSTTNSTALELNSTFGSDFVNKAILSTTFVRDDRGIDGDPFPSVEINDGTGTIFLGSEPFSTANVLNQDIVTFTNNFTWFRGAHTLTFGTNFEYYDISNLFIPQNFGAYEYGSAADFLQSVCAAGDGSSAYCQENYDGEGPAAPGVYQRGYSLVDGVVGDGTDAIGAFSALQFGLYAQDEYQVNDRLRLTLGLRVDIPKVTSEPNFAPDALTETIPAVEAFYDLDGARPGETPAALPYLSPRFGFNYDLTGERRAQLRGGIGVFTGRVPFVWPGGMFLNNGTNTGFIFRGGGRFSDPDPDDEEPGAPIPFVPNPENAFTGADFGQDDIPSGRLEIFEENFRYPQVLRTALGADVNLPYGFVGTLEGQFTKTLSNIRVVNVNLNPTFVTETDGPGARPIYEPDADVLIDDRYSAIHRVGNTSEGYTYDVTARVQKEFANEPGFGNVLVNLAYTYGDAFAVNDGTSSQINTMWRTVEIEDYLPNDSELSRSDFSIGHRLLASVTYRKEFLNNLGTTVSLFYTGESGRPFNYTIDNFGSLIGAPGYRDYGLLYVPNDASELVFGNVEEIDDDDVLVIADAAEQAGIAADLETFIASSDYLSDRRGQFAERNGSRFPFEHIFDLRLSQELFGNLGGERRTLEVELSIFNLGNLLNSDWGLRYNKFTSSSNGGFELLEFEGFCGEAGGGTSCGSAGDLTPVYSLNIDPDDTPTEEAFFESELKDSGTYSSRWQMQLGLRLTF